MSSEIMGPELNTDQQPRLFRDHSGRTIGYRENPLAGFDPFQPDVWSPLRMKTACVLTVSPTPRPGHNEALKREVEGMNSM